MAIMKLESTRGTNREIFADQITELSRKRQKLREKPGRSTVPLRLTGGAMMLRGFTMAGGRGAGSRVQVAGQVDPARLQEGVEAASHGEKAFGMGDEVRCRFQADHTEQRRDRQPEKPLQYPEPDVHSGGLSRRSISSTSWSISQVRGQARSRSRTFSCSQFTSRPIPRCRMLASHRTIGSRRWPRSRRPARSRDCRNEGRSECRRPGGNHKGCRAI